MIAIRKGRETGIDGVHSLYEIGCTATLRRVDRHEDGRFDIVTAGTRRFRLLGLDETRPYLQGEVELLAEEPADPAVAGPAVRVIQAAFREYLDALTEWGGATVRVEELPDEPELLSFLVAAAIVIELPERQALLAESDTLRRMAMQRALLSRETAMLRTTTSRPGRSQEHAVQPELGQAGGRTCGSTGMRGRGELMAEPETGASEIALRAAEVASDVSETEQAPRSGAALWAPSSRPRHRVPGQPAAARASCGGVRAMGPAGWPIRWSRWRRGSGCAIRPRFRLSFPANHPTRSPTRSSRARPAPRRRRAVRRAWRPRCRCCPPSRPRSWPRRWSWSGSSSSWSQNCTRPTEAGPRGSSPNG